MRYKGIYIISFCVASLTVVFWPNDNLRNHFLTLGDEIKYRYHNTIKIAKDYTERFFSQSKMIAAYQKKIENLDVILLENTKLKSERDSIYEIYPELPRYQKSEFYPALVLSYASANLYDKVWLKSNKSYQDGRILGIVKDNVALGIAIAKEGRLLGLLNGNESASYSVFIGPNKIPAILRKNPDAPQLLLADFIPEYFEIKIGDEVVTSGLDDIFIENLRVGHIEKIISKNGYVSANIKPYAKQELPRYVFIVDKKDVNITFIPPTLDIDE